MEQQPGDRALSLELASQALAATGSKSNLKATEWILNQRRAEPSKITSNAKGQAKMDHFFLGGNAAKSSQAISRAVVAAPDSAMDVIPAGRLLEDDTSSGDLQSDQEIEKDQSGATVPVGGGARAGIVGGFDVKTGVALGWRSVNTTVFDKARGEHEDVGSSGYETGRDAEVRHTGKGGLMASGVRGEGAAGGSSTKLKRTISPGTVQGGNTSGSKRHRQDATEANAGRTPPPGFSPPQFLRSNKQKFPMMHGKNSLAPLAERMRPATIDEVVGQDHLLAPRHMLRSLLENDTVPSIILYGPPGTGKTSLARAIARAVPALRFVGLSAVNSGTKEVKEVLEQAKRVKKSGHRTLLFLDEVHRFNKAQQDLFLPAVEAGHIVFIGATTENPSFEINAALLSRCRVLTLVKLEPEHLRKVLERAIEDRERGVFASLPEHVSSAGGGVIEVEEEALNFLVGAADGDARVALNAIEAASAAAYSEVKVHRRIQHLEMVTALSVPTVRSSGLERVGSLGSSTGVTKKEVSGLSIFGSERDRSGNEFCTKRLEALRESAKESLHSKEDYTKPFKRFVGGKEVTPVLNTDRSEREVLSLSSCVEAKEGLSLRGVEVTEAMERKGTTPDAIVPLGEDLDASASQGIVVTITLAQVREAFQRSHILYDKTGEEHYNTISALHKSMRGGDADAAIYWLARMLEGGEGPLYVARRLIRFASEDVGLGDPHAMGVAVACYQACHFLGMPECNVNLAQCVVYLALAPKSVVVYQAIEAAQKLIRQTHHNEPVPFHLRNAPTRLMKEMGYGKGYIYPPGQVGPVQQEYMPPSLVGHKFLRWP